MSKKKLELNKDAAPEVTENDSKLTLEKEETAAPTSENSEVSEDEVSAEEIENIEKNADTSEAKDDGKQETEEEDVSESADKSEGSDEEDDEKNEEKNEKKLSPEKSKKKEDRRDRRSLKARAFKRGWFSIALVALFIAAVILVNLIAGTLVKKVPALVADTTGSGNFDLSQESLDYLDKLTQDVKIIVLCDEKTYREGGEYYIQADSLLHKYPDNSSRISLEFMDLAANPTFTSQYPDEQLAQYGIIVQGENDYKYLSTMEYFDVQIDYSSYSYYIAGCNVDQAVTSAILNVTLDSKPKVSFISGISDEDYGAFKQYLDNNGFETEELTPAIDGVPEDTSILVLYAPNVDLDASYVDKISAFLNNGGSYGKQLLYLPSSSLKKLPNIDSLLEEWGVQVDNGYAVENDMSKVSQITYGVYLFAADYTDTTYTEDMKNSSLPFCVLYGNGVYTHPINILDENKAASLVKLSSQSTVLYPPETGDSAEPKEENSPEAVIAALATKGTTKNDTDSDSADTTTSDSHIIVIGSNYAVTESFLASNMYGNAPYMMSLLNKLVGRDNVSLTIEPQSLKAESINISSTQLGVLTVLYAVALPLIVLIAGIVIFVKRRNK